LNDGGIVIHSVSLRHPKLTVAAATLLALVATLVQLSPAYASSVTSAAFTGGAGTIGVGGTLYAKSGGALTLTVNTTADTKCVDVAGAFTGHQQSTSTRSTWTFTFAASAGNGVQTVTTTASPSFNPQGKCTGSSGSAMAPYTLDNTGPTVAATLSPAGNAAGWNKTNTAVTWSAIDAGSGVASGPAPASSTETADGIVTRTSTASDRLGNIANGSVTVRIDKAAPTITATQTSAEYGQPTTVIFTCDDPTAGDVQASGIVSCVADGTSPPSNSISVTGDAAVTGTATDMAGNTRTLTVDVKNVDTTPPTLSGAPTTQANGAGWYAGDVGVHWTAADPESGIPTPPADTTITGEGAGLTTTTTVKNGAGLETTATSTPAVNIDRTAPTTGLSGTSNDWVDGTVTVTLEPTDNLSGVASTSYAVDGGPAHTGTSLTLSTDGDHTVTFRSIDRAGNAETAQTAHVKIDQTAPTISHAFPPLSYTDGAWTNDDVTVTFDCADQGGSGLASCTGPVTRTVEGEGQQVVGTATDNAGNSATDTAVVSIDKTAPTIAAKADRPANGDGWYNDDVTVTFTATDVLSGIAGKTADEVLGEGADQTATGTATDKAGNSASAGVTGINVDKAPPVLTASFSSGWHTGDVTVNWSCSDALSGVPSGGQPADDVVTGEGANLSSTASCTDRAGNSATKTVGGIEIDRTAPTTAASVPAPPDSGWYTAAVTVTLDGSDNLSGVDATFYAVDGGAAQIYDGAFPVYAEGAHSIRFWSEDTAGNLETAGAPLTLKIDTTAPTTAAVNPISPASGWFVTSGVPFAFAASDADSGVAATYYTIDGGAAQTYGEPFTADLSTGTHTVKYWSVDLAGNTESTRSLTIRVDTVPPMITGGQTPAANGFGWNNTDVTVTFSCTDADSGIDGVAGCADDTILTNDGAGQMVHGDAVDVAGNRGSTEFGPVNIDKAMPTLKGVPDDPNAAGWHNGDVTVKWVGDDGLSGIDPATQPADSTITGEGSNLGAGPVTIMDRAGNTSDPASVGGIRIDRRAPVVDGGPTTQPNAVGWYNGDVIVGFSCSDPSLADGTAGSGVASCPSDVLLKGDGAGQILTSAPAADKAGNASAGKTVTGINIDGHEPQTTADNQCSATNGYCTGSTANVVLTSTDVGPSGVRELRYAVNGGSEQVAPGARKTVSVPLDGTGTATVSYYAVDHAGNSEPANQVALDYDNIAPTVTHTVAPAANAEGWNNGDVTVHFDAKDTDPGSGVAAGSITPDVIVDTETTTSGRVVNGSARDSAGNVGTDSVTVRLDKTAPSITGAVVAGTNGDNRWYVGPVTVHFTCSDALSGLAVCPDDVTLTTNGANQSVTGKATDKAGNSATATVPGISIDREKPTLTTTDVNVAGGTYTLGSVPTAACTATDGFSGVASCTVAVSGGNANGVGTFGYTATATDKAGNTATLTGTFRVIYRFDGFLQPINDTAHQVGATTSVFKAGSTVPAKFQLKNAAGTLVLAAIAPVWLTPVKGSVTSAPVDESAYTTSGDSGSTYRHDGTGTQYIYNWKTGAGGNWWRIGVRLDDGQTYYVNIGLR
jgi:hypothetical protein